mgnify:CR=1 FL=1
MRVPENLKKGGTIGFVAPSFGCTTEPYKSAFANAQKKELNAKLAAKTEKIESKDRRIEKLNARIQELKDKNYEIMNTKRYKVASFFAKPFEWFRKRNAEPEEKE